jgi:S-adenosylmethionine/arginine decarboxylase-like enzyme
MRHESASDTYTEGAPVIMNMYIVSSSHITVHTCTELSGHADDVWSGVNVLLMPSNWYTRHRSIGIQSCNDPAVSSISKENLLVTLTP